MCRLFYCLIVIGFLPMSSFYYLCGCRHYQSGNHLISSELQRLVLRPIRNHTDKAQLNAHCRQAIAEILMRKKWITLFSRESEATAILDIQIMDYKISTISETRTTNTDFFRPNHYRLTLKMTLAIYSAKADKAALIPERTIYGNSEIIELIDPEHVFSYGFKQAIYDAAQKIQSLLITQRGK